MCEVPRVAVVTFATTANEQPFNDYTHQIEALRKSATDFQLDFYLYTFRNLKVLIANSPFEEYPSFRRGVGGWFWKPLVILDFLERHNYDFVLYVDVDCLLLKNPIDVIQSIPTSCDLAGFKMSASIEDWTTSRVLKRLNAIDNAAESMWTAGILIIRNSITAKGYLNRWLQIMSEPRNLFDLPFESDAKQHRHDQSLFSILIAQDDIAICDLGEGFYSEGLESTSVHFEHAWIATGINIKNTASVQNDFRIRFMTRISNQVNYRRIRLTRLTFWVHYLVIRRLKKR